MQCTKNAGIYILLVLSLPFSSCGTVKAEQAKPLSTAANTEISISESVISKESDYEFLCLSSACSLLLTEPEMLDEMVTNRGGGISLRELFGRSPR